MKTLLEKQEDEKDKSKGSKLGKLLKVDSGKSRSRKKKR
jgi:hypothetical protein